MVGPEVPVLQFVGAACAGEAAAAPTAAAIIATVNSRNAVLPRADM
jgi:hypothetical protein